MLQDSDCRPYASALAAAVSSVSSSALWHNRLGHPSHSKLHLLKQFVHVVDTNKSASCCDICHFSKQKKLPFASSTHVSNKPFDLIHCDLWGPFATSTIDGFRFFLTIDDFTRCTWVYLLKHKSEIQLYLPQFASMVILSLIAKLNLLEVIMALSFTLRISFNLMASCIN